MVGRGDRQQAIHSFLFDSSHKPPVAVGTLKRTKSREGPGHRAANNKTERDYHGKHSALELSENTKLGE